MSKRKKLRPLPTPPRASARQYVRLAPAHLAKFKFLLEGYDHLGYVSVVDRFESVAQIVYSPMQHEAVHAFLNDIRERVPFTLINLPASQSNAKEQTL